MTNVQVSHHQGPAAQHDDRRHALMRIIEVLQPASTRLPPPQPGDWLAVKHETGQSFAAYLASSPVTATTAQSVIYVQPLGVFSSAQWAIVTLTADFLQRFYQTDVRVLPAYQLRWIPSSARRGVPGSRREQLLTTYLLHDVLAPRLPSNALMMCGITAHDLYAGEGWNFVFGQAALRARVGVYSFHRFGNPDAGYGAFCTCLWRTVRTAVHEAGHMLGMKHCVAYQCSMNGSNSLEESDRRPLALCPECLAKLCWAMHCEPRRHCEAAHAFCVQHGLTTPARLFARQAELLRAAGY